MVGEDCVVVAHYQPWHGIFVLYHYRNNQMVMVLSDEKSLKNFSRGGMRVFCVGETINSTDHERNRAKKFDKIILLRMQTPKFHPNTHI